MIEQKKYLKKVIVTNEKTTREARAERLRRVRNMANLSREEMCQKGNLNINTYKGWEIARYGGLPVDGAERVMHRVAQEGIVCTVDWLLYEIGIGPYVIPRYNQQASTAEQLNKEEKLIMSEIALFQEQFPQAINEQIQDDGLSPFYDLGDFVAGINYYNEEIQSLVGKCCIIQTCDGRKLVRYLKNDVTLNKYMLVCTNPQTQVVNPVIYATEIVSAAPIIRHYRKKN